MRREKIRQARRGLADDLNEAALRRRNQPATGFRQYREAMIRAQHCRRRLQALGFALPGAALPYLYS